MTHPVTSPAAVALSVLAGLFRVGDLPPFVSSGRPALALHFFNPRP
jgi:hypothetical protein